MMTAAPAKSTRIAKRFAELRSVGELGIVAYITAGDPTLDLTLQFGLALAEAGADVIELGVPFSDPLADGPTIQRASERALKAGTTMAGVLELVRRIRQSSQVPLVLFSYYNPILQMGLDKFAKAAAEAGADGVLATDLTPEESEDFKINEIYQPIFSLEQKGDCQAAIQRYMDTIIPLAEKSKFEEPKNKYLYLANHGIGGCNLKLGNAVDAEKYLKQAMDYLPVWPGLSDSDYPLLLSQIAIAQIGQQHWESAEASLKKSVSVLDTQIEKLMNSGSENSRTDAGVPKGRKAKALVYLGIVYLREDRREDALNSAESAYAAATEPNVPPAALAEVVKYGRLIAGESGDQNAIALWSKRAAAH